MKFGRKLHQYQVPAWEPHYLRYRQLKALLRSAAKPASCTNGKSDFKEFDACLSRNITDLDGFFHRHNTLLRSKQGSIYERYSLGNPGTTFFRPELVDLSELEDVHVFLMELQEDYMELLWFCRVNYEALKRVCAKLEKVDIASGHLCRDEMTRRLAEQCSHEDQCLEAIETLQVLIDDISRPYQLPQPGTQAMNQSLQLKIFYDQVPEASSYLNAIHECIRTDQASGLAKILEEIPFSSNDYSTMISMLNHSFLALSISSRAWRCARSLVAEESALNVVLVDHKCLIHLIEVLGRSTKHHVYDITKEMHTQSMYSGLEEAGTSLFLHMLEHLGPRTIDILWARDAVGRLPLHHCAMYGLTTICQEILKSLHDRDRNSSTDREAILTADDEGFTPLHWSVIHGHSETTRIFLAVLNVTFGTIDATQDRHLSVSLSELLLIALRNQDDAIVHLLTLSHIDISYQSSSGETGLYIAAKVGRADYVKMLIQVASRQSASIDIPETAYGWTPLFIACVEGSITVVELLLQAGADENSVDYLGWTPKEHAAFGGHLPVAEMFGMSKTVGTMIGPAQTSRNAIVAQKFHLRPSCTYIIVNLGALQDQKQINPVDFEHLVPEPRGAKPNARLFLEISTSAENSITHLLRLPLLDDPIDNTLVFPANKLSELRLNIRLYSTSSTHSHRDDLIGRGTFLLQDDRSCFGKQRETLIREHSVPIIGTEAMDYLGNVTFSFIVARPFPHLNSPTPSVDLLKSFDSVQLVGHRGLGQNLGDCKYLQLGENTIESFLSAAKLGASYVEFDVQVTRDLAAVLYHDFSLSESGTDVPIHDLTLKQFMYASNIQSPRGDLATLEGNMKLQASNASLKPRSRSLTRDQETGAEGVQDRMKYTVDFNSKGFKPNTRGDFIQGSFATLEEAFLKVPDSVGFAVEIKYPRIHEALDAGVAPVTIDLNTFIDTILTAIVRFAGPRKIMLSSFTPDVCILLALKQKAYPVLFITNAGKRPVTDRELRAGSLQAAVRFATQWGLAGIVCASDVFVMCPRLVAYVKRKGLVCGSYGPLNNVPETVQLQVKAGVDLIIADRVGLISKTLKSPSVGPRS